jgi:hypothetical protein
VVIFLFCNNNNVLFAISIDTQLENMQRLFLSLFTLAFGLGACSHRGLSKKFGLPEQLVEVSGLYYAGPDSLWWHNDSGGGPWLYLTDDEGRMREKRRVPEVANTDWEDISADPEGRLYIGDFGNNANNRRDLRIYIFDPADQSVDVLSFEYPDQESFPPPAGRMDFDMEAFFWYRDSLHLFSKDKLGQDTYLTKHYVLPARPGHHLAELRDSLWLDKRVVAGAAISPDGKAAALVTYWFKPLLGIIPLSAATVYVFEDFPGTHFLRGRMRKQKIPKGLSPVQYESIDFIDNHTVLTASERTIFFKQKARRLTIERDSSIAVLP